MITLSGEEPILLEPGHYWIELDFERPVTRQTLLQALREMGFDRIVLEPEERGRFGASASMGPSGTSSTRSATITNPTAPSQVSTSATATPAPPTISPRARARSATSSPSASPSPSSRSTSVASASASSRSVSREEGVRLPKGSGLGTGPSDPEPTPAPATGATPTVEPKPNERRTSVSRGGNDGEGSGPPGDDALPTTEEAEASVSLPSSKPPPAVSQTLPSAPDSLFRASPAPATTESKRTSLLPWALLGTAGAAVAAAVLFAGSSDLEENPYLFRLTAHLTRLIAARNLPGLWWRSIHQLAIDPTENVGYNLVPHRLVHGTTYDLRVLSRDKTATRRPEIVQLLRSMGFDPADALLVRRNIRAPGRPGTSLSEWLAVGTWNPSDSYTTIEDPLLFVDARPSS